jgi:hypothetical protein
MQDQVNATPAPLKRVPWNKGKVTGAKPPLRPKHVWSIRTNKLMSETPGQSGHALPDFQQPVWARNRHGDGGRHSPASDETWWEGNADNSLGARCAIPAKSRVR